MNNRKRAIIFSSAALILLLILMVVFLKTTGKDIVISEKQQISLQGGTADSTVILHTLPIPKAGDYRFSIRWQVDHPGFLSGFVIKAPDGQVLFSSTADCCECESELFSLVPADYRLEIHILTDPDALLQFINTYIDPDLMALALTRAEPSYASGSNAVNPGMFRKGSWEADFRITASRRDYSVVISMFLGGLIGLAATALLLTLSKNGTDYKCKYDERQELLQGRAFKYAFYTLLIYLVFLIFFAMGNIRIPAEQSVVLSFGVIFSISVFAVYSIWKEAYFSLNENKVKLFWSFSLFLLFNLIIGIWCISSDPVIENGVLTYRCINLFLGIWGIFILIGIFIKQILSKREELQSDADEEDAE